MKTLACGDLVPGCEAVVRAESEEEILRIAAQHAVEAHGLTVDDGLVAAVKGAIREEEASRHGVYPSTLPRLRVKPSRPRVIPSAARNPGSGEHHSAWVEISPWSAWRGGGCVVTTEVEERPALVRWHTPCIADGVGAAWPAHRGDKTWIA